MNTPLHELENEFLELMFEYEEFLRMHQLRVTKGAMEVLVTTTAEVAEDLVKMKWSKVAKAPFEWSRNKIALYDAEQDAPGRRSGVHHQGDSSLPMMLIRVRPLTGVCSRRRSVHLKRRG